MLSLHTANGQAVLGPAALASAVRARAAIVLDVELLEQPLAGGFDPDELAGHRWLGEHLSAVHLWCRGPEWSLDMAAFATDVAAYAGVTTGIEQTLLATVVRTAATPDATVEDTSSEQSR